MDSNYVSLGNYYRNQNQNKVVKENFADYNVGKFDLQVVSNTAGTFRVVKSDFSSDVDVVLKSVAAPAPAVVTPPVVTPQVKTVPAAGSMAAVIAAATAAASSIAAATAAATAASAGGSFFTIKLNTIPVGKDIKSISIFTVDKSGSLYPTAFPMGSSQNVFYNPTTQELSFKIPSNSNIYTTLNSQNKTQIVDGSIFARIYVTW